MPGGGNYLCLMNFKPYHPPHIYLDNTIYFIAARTRDKINYFESDQKKLLLKNILFFVVKKYTLDLYAWVILNNHYHLLLSVKGKESIYKFIKSLHGKSAVELNKLEKKSGRKVWVNYWDHGIRDEEDFYLHFNYIHHNPVKHGYVKRMGDYKFSSYGDYRLKNSQEWLDSCFELRHFVVIRLF